jgi:hypothetical protein
MALMFLAAMMMAEAPAAAQPQSAGAQAPVAKQQKPKQICEYIEVTGSRSKRRVCRDDEGNLDLGPGVRSGSYGQDSGGQSSVGRGPGA